MPSFLIKMKNLILMEKYATGQSCIHNEVTFYKIHILPSQTLYPPSFKHPQASPRKGLLTMHIVIRVPI